MITHLKRRLLIVLLALLACACSSAVAATDAKHAAADKLPELYRDKVVGMKLTPIWANGASLIYRASTGPRTHAWKKASAESPEPSPAFDHAILAQALAKELGEDVAADALPLQNVKLIDGDAVVIIEFDAGDKRWRAKFTDGVAIEMLDPVEHQERQNRRESEDDARSSPDGTFRVILRDHNVFLKRLNAPMVQVSFDGSPTDAYDGRVYWSPDSKKFVVLRTRDGFDRKVKIVRTSPVDQLQPELIEFSYRKAGDQIPIAKPQLFHVEDAETGEPTQVKVDDALWPNPWSIRDIRWRGDASAFSFVYNERGHLVMRVVSVNADTGVSRTVIEEARDTHIAHQDKYYLRWIDDTRVIWMSERDGWNHLYLFDADKGEIIRQLTQGDWAVRKIIANDDEKQLLWLQTYGRPDGRDPLYTHFAKVDLDGNVTWLTDADGTHDEPSFSPDRSHYTVTWSRIDQPPVHEFRGGDDGQLLATLEEADASALYATGWKPPIAFAAEGRDETLIVHGAIYTPTDLDESKKYPIIEDIYMGLPIAPKGFQAYNGRRALAELGFIVVVNDPAVTVWPSRRHWDIGYKNLGDAGFPDRIPWIKAAAAKFPFMDLDRVGIYGTSAGGQASLRGMLMYPDFYKVCVSACGCHDNRIDKIWWNEYWMGWPVGPHYAEQSNVTHAAKLQGHLLLILGEVDQNVDPASTMQVVDALIQADKDFDLLVIPNAGHTSGGSYGERKRREFFVEHLLDVDE